MALDTGRFSHPAFRAALGTVLGYGLILGSLTALLFLGLFAIFRAV